MRPGNAWIIVGLLLALPACMADRLSNEHLAANAAKAKLQDAAIGEVGDVGAGEIVDAAGQDVPAENDLGPAEPGVDGGAAGDAGADAPGELVDGEADVSASPDVAQPDGATADLPVVGPDVPPAGADAADAALSGDTQPSIADAGDAEAAADAADVAGPACTGATCDDGNACTVGDKCIGGKCLPGTPMACDDGNACTEGDWCKTGACIPGASKNCDDANSCTTDNCDTSGGCKHVPLAAGEVCGTGKVCDAAGACGLNACPYGYLAIDVDGKALCAADFPVWGIRPVSPPAAWFKDNGDGTVTDSQSGLVWETGFSQPEADSAGAKAYCQSLQLGGQADWRLPTRSELQTLIDFEQYNPAIVLALGTTPASWFWSASPFLVEPGNWGVNFQTGRVDGIGPAYAATYNNVRTRCVRAGATTAPGSAPLSMRYKPSSLGGAVYDTVTSLTWQKDGLASGVVNWDAAAAYCKSLALEGGGWRAPSIVELLSIVDVQLKNPALDKSAFPGAPVDNAWSSTGVEYNSLQAWKVYIGNGDSYDFPKVSGSRVRCVK